ncbi:peptidoglycan-binding protein [Candidatus Parcubacteria bacterium]|nr:peptidoglycan-binding protein [Candidatus Parcubacteria bacterium]
MSKYSKFLLVALSVFLFSGLLVHDSSAAVVPLSASSMSPSSPLSCYDFDKNLNPRSKDAGVRFLQFFLQKEGYSIDPSEYGTYGSGTTAAVKGFQEKYSSATLAPVKLSSGTGRFGKLSRAKLNSIYSCSAHSISSDWKVNFTVPNMTLDNTGVTANFCNQSQTDVPVFPIRIRLNGINRDFDILDAHKAGACSTEKFLYEGWGLSYDSGSTFTAVVLMDPTNIYKSSQLQYPLSNTTATLKVPAITGTHLAVRSILMKNTGIQITACNLGTTNLPSYPVKITVNGISKDLDVPGAYASGKCAPIAWPYSTWNLTYTPDTVYNVTVISDPNNIFNEVNEYDNAATVIGIP